MVKIMEIVVCAKRKELDRCPRKLVARVSEICIPDSQDKPADQGTDVNRAIQKSKSDIYQKRDRLDEKELYDMKMQSGNSNARRVLVMNLVKFVKIWLMQQDVEGEKDKVFDDHHEKELRDEPVQGRSE